MIKSKRMRWAGHAVRRGLKLNSYRVLVGKPELRRQIGRPKLGLEDNIKIVFREIEWGDMALSHVAQDKDQWRALVKTVINLRVPNKYWEFSNS
jgi:hypothetical protein